MTHFPVEFFRSWVGMKILQTLLVEKKPQINISTLHRKLFVTYSQVWQKVDELMKMGLLTKQINGRDMFVELTPKGRIIAEAVDGIVKVLE